MRLLVAGWVGSTNLGDELVHAGLLRLVRRVRPDAEVSVLSVDPDRTAREHGVRAVPVRSLPAEAARADLLLLGGGGLLQDETSPLNLPYHLARPVAARLRGTPVLGLGLGAGRLDTAPGRTLVRAALRGVPLTVRDAPSADLLAGLGLARPVVAADLALELPDVEAPVVPGRLTVSLRPWSGARSLLPAGLRARWQRPDPAARDAELQTLAAGLDDAAARTGLVPHLVALQPDRDGPWQDEVADRMRGPVTCARPALDDVLAEVASGEVVAAMRYHAGIAAVLAGRPVVLVGYSPKVDALAAELGAGARLLAWDGDWASRLAPAVKEVQGHADEVRAGRAALRRRSEHSAEALAARLPT